MSLKLAARLLVASGAALAVLPASAQFFFEFRNVAVGDTPSGGPVFARLDVEDVAANTVRMRLTHSATALPQQFLTSVSLNIDPFVGVTVSPDPVSSPSYRALSGWEVVDNGINAPMGTRFDLRVDFTTANNGNRMTAGSFSQWTVVGSNLTAQRFWATASQGQPWYGVLRIQGTGPNGDGSSWVTSQPVPEPGTMLALGAGLAAFVARRRRRS